MAETEWRCHWDACPHGANCVHAEPTTETRESAGESES